MIEIDHTYCAKRRKREDSDDVTSNTTFDALDAYCLAHIFSFTRYIKKVIRYLSIFHLLKSKSLFNNNFFIDYIRYEAKRSK